MSLFCPPSLINNFNFQRLAPPPLLQQAERIYKSTFVYFEERDIRYLLRLLSITQPSRNTNASRQLPPVQEIEMGLFSSDAPSLPAPKISSDGAPIAPDRSQRAKCWEARDAYFGCLDKNGIIDSIAEKNKAEKGCASEGKGFEANCASSWVCSLISCSPVLRKDGRDWNDVLTVFRIGDLFQETESDGTPESPDTGEAQNRRSAANTRRTGTTRVSAEMMILGEKRIVHYMWCIYSIGTALWRIWMENLLSV